MESNLNIQTTRSINLVVPQDRYSHVSIVDNDAEVVVIDRKNYTKIGQFFQTHCERLEHKD